MPKGFTEREKEIIREQLIEKGSGFFSTYGLKRTNIEDLTRAVGISKGAFYLFFPSKEELWLEIMQRFEEDFREKIFQGSIEENGLSPREHIKAVLLKAFAAWKAHPLFKHFNQEELDYVVRKLPPEKLAGHMNSDEVFLAKMIERWKADGLQVREDTKQITGLVKALYFISFHEQEIGEVYPRTMETLVDLVVNHIFIGGE